MTALTDSKQRWLIDEKPPVPASKKKTLHVEQANQAEDDDNDSHVTEFSWKYADKMLAATKEASGGSADALAR